VSGWFATLSDQIPRIARFNHKVVGIEAETDVPAVRRARTVRMWWEPNRTMTQEPEAAPDGQHPS
jgi:hypothetical protein